MSESTFQALLVRLRQGDRSAWAELFLAFGPRLHAAVVRTWWGRDRVEDAVQEAFLRLGLNPNSLSPATTVETFPGWLFRVARNWVCHECSHDQRLVPLPEGTDLPASEPEPNWETAEWVARVWKEVDQLPPHEKGVIRLRYQEGMSLVDIAQTLKELYGTIQARHFRGLRRLRAALGVGNEPLPGDPESGSVDTTPPATAALPVPSPETDEPPTEVEQ